MWRPDRIVAVLRERGELWEAAPGLTGLRGDALALFQVLERAIRAATDAETRDEWRLPPGISLEALARADYFASFPHWLTAAAHLSDDPEALERVALAADPADAARRELAPSDVAMTPALCYHAYAALAGKTLTDARLLACQGTCWRHEAGRLAPLERCWAFTMREVVCIGAGDEVEAMRRRGIRRAADLAASLGIEGDVVQAADPFFAPTARGRALLQRVKALKHELVLPIGRDHGIAAASFNHHETFFGESFDIRLSSGDPAASGCVAFGIERWLLAFLVAHGPDGGDWPAIPAAEAEPVRLPLPVGVE